MHHISKACTGSDGFPTQRGDPRGSLDIEKHGLFVALDADIKSVEDFAAT